MALSRAISSAPKREAAVEQSGYGLAGRDGVLVDDVGIGADAAERATAGECKPLFV